MKNSTAFSWTPTNLREGLAELPPEHDAECLRWREHKDFFDADDDEPIALSADELDGIAATAVEEEAPVCR
jgi:hypothetical protein